MLFTCSCRGHGFSNFFSPTRLQSGHHIWHWTIQALGAQQLQKLRNNPGWFIRWEAPKNGNVAHGNPYHPLPKSALTISFYDITIMLAISWLYPLCCGYQSCRFVVDVFAFSLSARTTPFLIAPLPGKLEVCCRFWPFPADPLSDPRHNLLFARSVLQYPTAQFARRR